MEAAARAFEGYTLALPPRIYLYEGEDPGGSDKSPSFPSVTFEPETIHLPLVFPLPPVLVVPVPRLSGSGGCGLDILATVSNVTEYPKRADKNGTVTIGGTLVDGFGRGVGDVEIELFLNETKEEPGVLLGRGFSDATGHWTVRGRFPVPLEAQRYHLVAHSLEHEEGCAIYRESWSDPELDLHAGTALSISCPERILVGREERCEVVLRDEVGAPVPSRRVSLAVDSRPIPDATTDGAGRFTFPVKFDAPGTHFVSARYAGDKHYGASEATREVTVVEALVELQSTTITVSPGGKATLRGQVVSFRALPPGPLALDAAGFDAPRAVPYGSDGRFEVTVSVPPGTPVGERTLTLDAPWLHGKPVPFLVRVVHATALELDAPGKAPAWSPYEVTARLTTGEGEPLAGREIALVLVARPFAGADERATLRAVTDADGVARFPVERARWGEVEATASYAGGDDAQPSRAGPEAIRLVLPWWALALAALAILALAAALALWARRYAATRPLPPLPSVPALSYRYLAPGDEAPWIAGVGETVSLEIDRPPGATRLAIRAGRHLKVPATLPLPDGKARLDVRVSARGARALRLVAEDARGKAVAAADVPVRGVVYAEEIERAYGDLVEGSDASMTELTPREFEALLLARPGVKREELSRAVTLFEIADYSARRVGREAFLAFRAAKRALAGGDDAAT